MTINTTTETNYQTINHLITDGSAFHAALAWLRLSKAADAVTVVLDEGLELDLLLTQINNLRSDAWAILWDKTEGDADERDAALECARQHLAAQPVAG